MSKTAITIAAFFLSPAFAAEQFETHPSRGANFFRIDNEVLD
jgi:hypothetical protein